MTGRSPPTQAADWRLAVARAAVWSLSLGGWIGVAAFAERLTAGPLAAGFIVALWLLATGLASDGLGRMRWSAGACRLATPVCAGLASCAMWALLRGDGSVALWGLAGLALAWAGLLALASASVRALRRVPSGRAPGSPIGAGAAGALLVWGVVGDPTDLPALADRLAMLAGAAALVLAALRPGDRPGAAPVQSACRAALVACALPAWPASTWHRSAHWPLQLSALVMLPMMWSLPSMLALCRSDALSPQAVLGLHLAAMFLPACALGLVRTAPSTPARLAPWCGGLLVIGGLAAVLGGPWTGWGPALAHGAAWSLAWAAHRPDAAGTAWRAAALSAGLVLLLGALQAQAGAPTLAWVHAVFGLLAGVALWAGRPPVPAPARTLPLRGAGPG